MTTQREAEVILKVNSKEAQEKLERLENQAADLRERFAEAFRKGDTRGIDAINRQLTKVNKEIDNMRTNAANIRAAMVRLDEASPRELQRTIKLINNELNSGRVKRGTKEWDEYVDKLKEVQSELQKVKKEMEPDNKESFFDRLKNGINEWGETAAAGAVAFAGVVMSGKAAVDSYADMEAEEANVRKYTGMTAEEVGRLNEKFKEMDTRTSREDLNKLAQEAGRLGKTSVKDVLGFVKAADQINVALDDLGDGATLTLSKLTGIFGDEKIYGTEQSLLKVGSVINELSQNCSASAPYLAEFSSRIGGIAAQSKMTISQVMAFAAVLDTQNLAVEASSTAVGQLITSIYQEPSKIAKAAGLDVKKFSDMVKTDMNGALIMLFEHLNKFGGMETLSKVFDDMGTDGARAIPVLTALSGHVEELKWQQGEANKAFAEGISITKEFNVQNNTVQARLDKAKKGFNEMAVSLGKQLLPVMSYCISGTSLLMRVMSTLVSFFIKHRTAILTLTAAIAAYNVVLALNVHWSRLATTWTTLWTAAQTKFSGVASVFRLLVAGLTNTIQYFTNGLEVNYAMQARWRKAMAGMSFASWTGAIVALTAALVIWLSNIKKTISAEQELNGIRETAKKNSAEEVNRLRLLQKMAKDETASLQDRIEAVNELNRIVPEYNGNLDETTGAYSENKKALDDYIESLIRLYEIEGAKEKLQDFGKQKAELNIKKKETQSQLDREIALNARQQANQGPATSSGANMPSVAIRNMGNAGTIHSLKSDLEDINKELDDIKRKEDLITKTYGAEALMPKVAPENPEVENPQPPGITPQLPESEKERKEREKKEREALKKALDERKSLYLQSEAENLTMYVTGQRNYADYLARKEKLEKDYVNDVVEIHKEHNQIDIAAYGQALKSKADLLKKQQDAERKRKLVDVETEHKENTDAATSAYFNPSSSAFQDKKKLNQMLFQEDIRYLEAKRVLYSEDSEEWVALEREYNDRIKQDRLDKQKELAEAIEKYRQEFGDNGRAAAYRTEIEMIELLHKQGLIKEQEYQEGLEKIRSKYRTVNMSESFQSAEQIFSRLVDLMPGQLSPLSAKLTEWLSGLSDEEREMLSEGFEKGFDNIIGNTLVNGFSGVISLIEGFNAAAAGNWDDIIGNLGEMAQNAANIIGGIMSTFSSYWNAQRDIEISAIEKRYDREIEAAGKNTKKKEKLEKQKEADIAKVKNKYNDRAMKMEIAQAIAQTAANALGAYGAMVEIPVVGPALAAAAAAMATAAGMIQIATIKKQHEAQAAGFYEGGFTTRDADNRREVGVVHANEFVANHQAVANPALVPVLRLIDTAQRNNTVGSLTAADVSNAIGQGSGVSARGDVGRAAAYDSALIGGLSAVAQTNIAANEVMARLYDALEDGIEAKVILDGEDGFHKKYTHYQKLRNNPKR